MAKHHHDHEGTSHDLKHQVKHFGTHHPFDFLTKLEAIFDEYFIDKAPFAFPGSLKDFLVKIAPYLTILFVIVSIPAVLALFGLGTFFHSMMWSGYYGGSEIMFYIIGILTLIILLLQILAIPGLFARTKQAWNLIYYIQLISLIMSVLQGNII